MRCNVGFEFLTAMVMMMMMIRVFGDVTPSKIDLLDLENGSSTTVRKVGNCLPIDTV